jgi:hypothetical protein
LPAEWVVGDSAFDADLFRDDINALNAQTPSPRILRGRKNSLSTNPSARKGIWSNAASTSSSFFAVSLTRYEKMAGNFLAMITVAAMVLWLR